MLEQGFSPVSCYWLGLAKKSPLIKVREDHDLVNMPCLVIQVDVDFFSILTGPRSFSNLHQMLWVPKHNHRIIIKCFSCY